MTRRKLIACLRLLDQGCGTCGQVRNDLWESLYPIRGPGYYLVLWGEETAVSVLRLMSLRTEVLSVELIGILVVHVTLSGCSALLMM